jgi:hypothetical protein
MRPLREGFSFFRELSSRSLSRLATYEGEVRKAVQAYNGYVHLRNQSDANLRRRGLSREGVSREVFRQFYDS